MVIFEARYHAIFLVFHFQLPCTKLKMTLKTVFLLDAICDVLDRFGLFCVILGRYGWLRLVSAGFGWFRLVSAGFGMFWVILGDSIV